MRTLDDVIKDIQNGKAGIKELKQAVADDKAARAEALRALTSAAFEAGRGGNASLLANIHAQIDGGHYIKLPYQITPNSVLYWNDDLDAPGMATFNDRGDAADFYASEVKKEGEYYGDN